MSHAHPPSRPAPPSMPVQGHTARRSSIFNIIEDPGTPPPPRTPGIPRTVAHPATRPPSAPAYSSPYSANVPQQQHGPPPPPHPHPYAGSRTNPILVPSNPASPSPNHSSAHPVHPVLQPFSPDQLPPNPFNSPRRRAKKTAEKRALHNEIERRRRCNLNESVLVRFLPWKTLGRLIPSLAAIHRPSQNQILTSTLAYVQQQQADQAIVARELSSLHHEATVLREEVNDWRVRAGQAPAEEPGRSEDFYRLVNAVTARAYERPRLGIAGEEQDMDEDASESETGSSAETDYRLRSGGSRSSRS
ncbi:hypothetical protein CALCODRAFT_482256 [Calocera cornea HHB12733]|uniref:BHLH domain-containing protein n=1 Tax=Calocera cornea HHB12733 TaxID=1353952 RepID=A0A165GY61_9BASI|nr:hypothetical protein CALCODRAFT_482256 [Calocera cornea HHB12733]